jgi:hypothetical protein
MREMGLLACLFALIQGATSLATLTYVFVVETGQRLPDVFRNWWEVEFTREFYVCQAFPSLVDNADRIFGFMACDYAVCNHT